MGTRHGEIKGWERPSSCQSSGRLDWWTWETAAGHHRTAVGWVLGHVRPSDSTLGSLGTSEEPVLGSLGLTEVRDVRFSVSDIPEGAGCCGKGREQSGCPEGSLVSSRTKGREAGEKALGGSGVGKSPWSSLAAGKAGRPSYERLHGIFRGRPIPLLQHGKSR